jgi:hypothetical protein
METVYIKGRGKYRDAIRKALHRSKLKEGGDYIEGNHGKGLSYMLIWIKDRTELRALKLAITAKIVWKHRLKFYFKYEDMNPKKYDYISEEDKLMLSRIKNGDVTIMW